MVTGVALGVVVVLSVLMLPTRAAASVFGIIWMIGAWEWAGLAGFSSAWRAAYTAAFLAAALVVLSVGIAVLWLDAVLWLAVVAWLSALVAVVRAPAGVPPTVRAVFGLLCLVAAWVSFYRIHDIRTIGPSLILAGLVIVWCADIGAFFVGRRFGRIKLAPSVSPQKTWEGVAGGIGLASLAGLAAALVLELEPLALVPVAAAMALISVVGDLSVSLLKRWAGVKDTGVLLPGHGGIMDRFDGVTAVLPFFALGLQFAHVLD